MSFLQRLSNWIEKPASEKFNSLIYNYRALKFKTVFRIRKPQHLTAIFSWGTLKVNTDWLGENIYLGSYEKKELMMLHKLLQQGSFAYDIGANIGLYSCYAAKKGIKTFSFEPSVFNLEILAKNINVNKLNNFITIVPISLCNKNIISNFNLQTSDHGGALSTFLEKYSYDGKSFDIVLYYQTPGITLDTFVELFAIPQPNHIKIDVDGIEHLILQGSSKVIKKCNSILVEVNEKFEIQYNEVKRILESNNFKL